MKVKDIARYSHWHNKKYNWEISKEDVKKLGMFIKFRRKNGKRFNVTQK